jgi:RNA polymerase sigma factor (sigma-70 family)
VVASFFKAEFSYDPAKGNFRNYLRQLTVWRVCDRIGKSPKIHAEHLVVLETAEHDGCQWAAAQTPAQEMEEKERRAYRSTLLATMLEDVRNRVSPQTFIMFEMTKLQGRSPEEVAAQFKVKRNVVDNAAHRVLAKLKELAAQPEYRKEYSE